MAAEKNGKKVLVIDDDPMARDLYRAILENDGFEVVDAGSGEQGLALYKADKFDCVILDIFMPGMSGLDLIEEFDPDTTGIPVIAVSGSGHAAGSSPLHLAETLGASKGFSKDFEHGELLAEVRKLTGV